MIGGWPYWSGWTRVTWYPQRLSSVAKVTVNDNVLVARGLALRRSHEFSSHDTAVEVHLASIRLGTSKKGLRLELMLRTEEVVDALRKAGFDVR